MKIKGRKLVGVSLVCISTLLAGCDFFRAPQRRIDNPATLVQEERYEHSPNRDLGQPANMLEIRYDSDGAQVRVLGVDPQTYPSKSYGTSQK